jgi:hypothetical protein
LLFVAVGAACKGEIGLELKVPHDVRAKTAWFEIGGYKDGHCDALLPMLSNGLPEGATARVAFKPNDPVPKLGQMPNGKYAMAAVARGDSCEVLASGCNDQDLGSTGSLTIDLHAETEDGSGKCSKNASCQAVQCVPANDNGNPSVGAGCSLELIGAGPLAKPAGGEGTEVSAPAIAATSIGFVIVYREADPSGSGARITILPIDRSGGSLAPQRPPLPNPCSNASQTDGVGLIVNKDAALMALAKPPCGAKPELQLLNFTAIPDSNDSLAVGKFFVSASPNGDKVTLGAARSSALVGGQNLVVFAESGQGRIAHMDPAKGIVGPNGSFGAATGVIDTWIAGNDTLLALVAASSPTGAAPDPTADAAAQTNTDSTLNLLLLPANTPVDSINAEQNQPRAPITFSGQWASIAAVGGRVIIVSDGNGPRAVSYRAYDQNNDDPADTGGFSLDADAVVTSADVAIVGDRAYFAALESGGVGLHVFANATTRLTPLRDVSFVNESRISAMSTVRDGRVAVAATDSRVAVAWTTAKKLGKNDATGGYAVFACTP